jgi:hypothetical protein
MGSRISGNDYGEWVRSAEWTKMTSEVVGLSLHMTTGEGTSIIDPLCLLGRFPRTNLIEFDMIECSGHVWVKRHVSLQNSSLLSRRLGRTRLRVTDWCWEMAELVHSRGAAGESGKPVILRQYLRELQLTLKILRKRMGFHAICDDARCVPAKLQ